MTTERIRDIQNALITHINEAFSEIELLLENQVDDGIIRGYESVYDIRNTAVFKGKKPIAVIIGQDRIICQTWKIVFSEIMKDCAKIPACHQMLYHLRNQYHGTKRVLLTDDPSKMRSPIKIDKDLFVETHYDTQSLMNLLLRILNDVGYEYTNIMVVIRNNPR
jgi:hypothetical protein